MNLESGFSVPMAKRDVWAPVTPEKPVERRPNQLPIGMQQNQKQDESWQDLLGIYTGFLQDQSCGVVDMAPTEPTIRNISQNTIPLSSGLDGANHWDCGVQDAAQVDKVRSFDQNYGKAGSYLQNSGDLVPRKVRSLEELLGIANDTLNAPTVENASFISRDSDVERRWNSCTPDSMIEPNQDIGGYNLQRMPSSKFSVAYRPSYNLNLPQRSSEDEDSSCVTRLFNLGPATPNRHILSNNNHISHVSHPSIDEIWPREEHSKENFVLPQLAEFGEREQSGFVPETLSTQSPKISTTKEKENPVGGTNEEFNLNETPPQKAPKRRKHRPKVVVEGKPRRTPKTAKENKNPIGDPPTKRKYVRRKGINTSANQAFNAEPSQGKSCKRALNFELGNEVRKKVKRKEPDHQEDNNKGSDASINSNLDTGLNRQDMSTVKAVNHNICSEQKQTEDKISPQESLPPAVPPTASKGHTLNVIARSLNVLSTSINKSRVQGNYGRVHNHKGGGISQLGILENTYQQNLDGLSKPRLLSTPQLLEDLVGNMKKQESRRAYSNAELRQPLVISEILSHGFSEIDHFNIESIRRGQNNIGSSSSNIVNAANYINGPSIPSNNTSAEDLLGQTGCPRNHSLHAQAYTFHNNGELTYFGSEEVSALMNPTYETNKVTPHWYMNSIISTLRFQKQMAEIESHPFVQAQNNGSLTAVASGHLLATSHKVPKIIKRNEITDAPARMSARRKYTRKTQSNKLSSTDKVVQQETRNTQGHRHGCHLTYDSGLREHKKDIFPVDDITDRMKNLWISNNTNGTIEEEQNALVPYEAFEPIKKRRPRPKVNLDPETNRLWNLLMGIEGNESAEAMDEDKQKRWEEDRRVFRGRVDSFIARMHLVQGDRRFSKWKGSVVDSVIGVYLTQNVSDHLSSSAFMSLAAKFPLKSTNTRETSSHKARNPSAEYEVLVSHPDGTTCRQRMTREPFYDHNTVKSCELPEYGSERTFLGNKHTSKTEEQIVSSQSSSESMSFQASEDIRSDSGSNSEVDDQVTGSNSRVVHSPSCMYKESKGSTAFQKNQIQELGFSFADKRLPKNHQEYENLANRDSPGAKRSRNACTYTSNTDAPFRQRPAPTSKSTWLDMLMDTGDDDTDIFASLEKECTSSLTSALCDTRSRTGTEDLLNKAERIIESRPTEQQTQSFKFHESTVNHNLLTEHLEKKTNSPIESDSRDNQHFINCKLRGMPETYHQESIFLPDPVKSAEALRRNPTEKLKASENITVEPAEMKTVHASDVQPSKISTNSTARKQKAEKEQRNSFDWDSLRRQVQSEGGTRRRSSDVMDSLDYEALRNADVREISDSIKERGMNNMLAARMKDFLNRLVKEHGSIDLEWLRDVQPDKVKDYLLSIRGLGLKSVECVRLLTLQHLAFPVDTNVGRIAVRLGWVPLQPLPESLQLHLLEMYPVLESIQKYLWPRLCMLDQETLYELHYQLITFGKVFCTKRQPNCNACPLRGECRHFASAFASARFALPGPEERHIVCSDIPTNSSNSCGVVIKPMSLPPPEDYIGSGPGPMKNCEPIVEEPTTPESSIDIVERDIEDAFYEDPDEIPEIKLNIDEFATNLKSFIQENKEMQEGDMSKAIIALRPQFASIPAPKLKHVSRLRTEHQVYELPDSHPLLEGMDRREPDDPSPYLLAVWTPGETADSIQLPEGKCSSSESGMCNSNTCFTCNSTREAQAQTVRGTILIPCRTAMRGSFPLNGTYFQVNEVFADDKTSRNPIHVPRSLIWNLPRRTVYFGSSVSTIFKGMTTEGIQFCFWRGFVCVRGFDQKTRAPRPLKARLHLPASKIPKKND